MKKYLFVVIVLFLIGEVKSQTTLFFKPSSEEGKDAFLFSLNPNTNYSSHPDFSAQTGSNAGVNATVRSIIYFDLSSIPAGSIVTNASISLFSYDSPSNGTHRLTDGMNDCYIKRVTSSWEENTVTWNNQPSTTEHNRVYLPNSEEVIQDYLNINVSALVQDMINDSENSHGFIMQQVSETIYRSMIFGSSDNANVNLLPELRISYIEPMNSDSCVVFKPDSESGNDAYLLSLNPNTNYSSHPDFSAQSGTNSGVTLAVRGLVDFNLRSLPANINIISANLRLSSYNSSSNGSHTAYEGGNNESRLFRIIEPWQESEVTWNDQPAFTDINSQALNQTTNEILDYSVNMKDLVIDYITDIDNSYGFLLKLEREEPFATLLFGSSDNDNHNLHPRLEVCFNITTSIEDVDFNNALAVFPNPSSETINVEFDELNFNQSIVLYSINGRILKSFKMMSGATTVNISDLESGKYVISILDDSTSKVLASKIIVKQ